MQDDKPIPLWDRLAPAERRAILERERARFWDRKREQSRD